MTKADAYSEYHRQIAANPNREYAVIRDGTSEEFGVVIGEETSVRVPATLEGNWAIDSHYHPTFDWLDTRFRVIRESNFIARIPSKEDLLGVQAGIHKRCKEKSIEWNAFTGVIPSTLTATTKPSLAINPMWTGHFRVHAPEPGGRDVANAAVPENSGSYETWFNSLTPAGPKTPGNP